MNIKPQCDKYIFPDGHGVIVLAEGRCSTSAAPPATRVRHVLVHQPDPRAARIRKAYNEAGKDKKKMKYSNKVYLPKELDEKVAKLHLKKAPTSPCSPTTRPTTSASPRTACTSWPPPLLSRYIAAAALPAAANPTTPPRMLRAMQSCYHGIGPTPGVGDALSVCDVDNTPWRVRPLLSVFVSELRAHDISGSKQKF